MMTDAPAPLTDAEWFAALRRLFICDAEASGLSFPGNKAKIIELSSERENLVRALDLPRTDGAPRVDGWYFDDCLTGCYIEGEVDYRTFAVLALEFLARDVDTIADCNVPTARAFTYRFGPELTELLLDILAEGMGNRRSRHYRIERIEEDEETGEERVRYARLDTTDTDFEECGYYPCEAGDEGATLITLMQFDWERWEGLTDEVEQRGRAAGRVRRMPSAKAESNG